MTENSRNPDARRFVEPLPTHPNLEKQRKLAKELALAYWRGAEEAVARVQALHPQPPPADRFTLSDAQLVIARGYGFASWPKLKHKIERLTKTPAELFAAAVKASDVDGVRELLDFHPDLIARINEPLFDFKQPAIHVARDNLAMIDLLIAHGADINAKTSWELGGFGILETATPEQAAPLLARGATIDIWAAANLGMADRVRELLDADPALVNAKGGDGKRPLHGARTIEIAELLLRRGADIDALDDDHSSTPAQHLVGDRQEVCRFLVERGARTDLLLASALGDVERVRRRLDDDPKSIRMRVSHEWFPMVNSAPNGGHIYQWTLGFFVSAFQIARKRGHHEVLELLLSRSEPIERLLDALWRGDLATADASLAAEPGLVARAPAEALRQVADAARNNDTAATTAMLARGFPVTAQSQHGAAVLHWAAFHGNPDMVRAALEHNAPVEARDPQHDGPPMGWTIHGARHGWRGISTGRHDECARLLLAAGARIDESALPTGHDALDAVLREWFVQR